MLVVMVNGERHGEPSDDAMEILGAAVDLIDPPPELRTLFMLQLAQGKYADDGKRRIWLEGVE